MLRITTLILFGITSALLFWGSRAHAAPMADPSPPAALALPDDAPVTGPAETPLRPAMIAERHEASWAKPVAYTFHVVHNGEAHEVNRIEALTLAGESDVAWRALWAPTAGVMVAVPLGAVVAVIVALGAAAISVAAIGQQFPETDIEANTRWTLAAGGLGALVVGFGGAALVGLASAWVTRMVAPSEEELGALANVEYVEAGGVKAALAQRICLEDSE